MGAIIPQPSSEDRAAGGQKVEGSLVFDGSHSDHLKRTFRTGNQKQRTFSFWVRRGRLAATQCIFSTDVDSYIEGRLAFLSNDLIQITDRDAGSGSTDADLQTNARYRDPNEWIHVVFAHDTPNATGGDRMRLYVNGVEETSFGSDTNPPLNYDCSLFRNDAENYIGCNDGSDFFYGNLAQVYYIDGQVLDPTYFGYTDPLTGTWRPKKYTGSYDKASYNIARTWSGSSTNITNPANAFNGKTASGSGDCYANGGGNTDGYWDLPTNIIVTKIEAYC